MKSRFFPVAFCSHHSDGNRDLFVPFGLEEGNGIKDHSFYWSWSWEMWSWTDLQRIATTPWNTGRGVWAQCWWIPAHCCWGWICTIPPSDSFFRSDLFFSRHFWKTKQTHLKFSLDFFPGNAQNFSAESSITGWLWMSELWRWSGVTAGILSLRQVECCHQPLGAPSCHPSSQQEVGKK